MAELQLALDIDDMAEALSLSHQCRGLDVRVEIGTPLIVKYGMLAVRQVRQQLPHHFIVADCKTMDRGRSIVKMCAEAGANSVIVQAAAGLSTLAEARNEALRHGTEIMLDSLGTSEDVVYALQQHRMANHTIRHIGKDAQREFSTTAIDFLQAEQFHFGNDPMGASAIAGGITWENLRDNRSLMGYPIVIIGENFYGSSTPRKIVETALRLLCAPEAA